METLLAGDAASAPLVARLPASLLCRHAAAVSAELVAFQARLRDALASDPALAGVAAPVWTELPDEAEDDPAGAAAAVGEAGSRSASQPDPDDTAAGLGVGEGEVPQLPDEPLGMVAAGGFAATDGGEEDMWLAIEVGCGPHTYLRAHTHARTRTHAHTRAHVRTHIDLVMQLQRFDSPGFNGLKREIAYVESLFS